ncbi:hypothetical protein F5Y10DRAFT_239041 [Nemania abortiva]|nr:hypothetical protein F5Y10DRAFT_239041 [Nemania abortiva]
MASSSRNIAPSNSEYQHFVPQFMLRNYAHKYSGPQRTGKGKRGKKNQKDTLFRGELVVNNVNMKADPFIIEETKVSRILGQYDMYEDKAQPTAQQREIETMLGKLENHVSTIFRKIVKAFEAGDPNVWVTREERNSIRKFLFILKYRGRTFHRRFTGPDEYNYNDKSNLQAYMEKSNFKRPIDVWFHGLRTIMNLKMDTENWQLELTENMYRTDAMWFLMHSEMMYMAICTPSEPEAEFILTDNCYNVFEGPNTHAQNPATGEFTETGWTSFHEFAPLSPKLMIVLRSNLLPVPEEDSNPEIKAWRDAQRKGAVDDFYGYSVQSKLADLPINKARNNYSQVVNGRVQNLPGEDGRLLKSHKFCFSFFPVGMEHVNKINHILFDNAHRCNSIVFGSKETFFRTLEWYMTCDPRLGKVIVGDEADARRKLLENLGALMKSLGSTKEPVWKEGSNPDIAKEFAEMKAMERKMQDGLLEWMLSGQKELEKPEPPIGTKFAYLSLGGSNQTFFEDMELAQQMLKRRIKVDVDSQGKPEAIRSRNRQRIEAEYLTYPSARVLFYSKNVRHMVLGKNDPGYLEREMQRHAEDQPEDIIAQALHNKMTTQKINRLMFKTVMNDIDLAQDPVYEYEIWEAPPISPEGAIRIEMIQKFVFGIPGLLKECGIPEIERLALSQEQRIQRYGLSRVKGFPLYFLPDEPKMELLTRIMVRPGFRGALASSVKPGLLQKLEDVFFKVSFPTPPTSPPI